MLDDNKVVTLELSAEVAESLRKRRVLRRPVIGDDDWNEEIALPAAEIASCEDDAQEDPNRSQNNDTPPDDNVGNGEKDDELSFSPPPNAPLLRLDLERLVGYIPTNSEEVAEVAGPIKDALWGSEKECYQGLDARIIELFESGAARHIDSDIGNSGSSECLRYADIEYPPVMEANHCGEQGGLELLDTERVWKRLIQPHSIDVVNRLLKLLRDCSRTLTWKHAMHEEIRGLSRSETKQMEEQRRDWELYVWRQSRRKTQLEQLYNVRERLQERLDVANDVVDALTLHRNMQVKAAMEAEFGEDVSEGHDKEVRDDEDFAELFGGIACDNEEPAEDDLLSIYEDDESTCTQSTIENETAESAGGSLNGDTNSTDCSTRSESKDVESSVAGSESVGKVTLEKERRKQERAAEELELRESLTSADLRLNLALQNSLEKKLTQVDNLLESLQEDEWRDEEEGIAKPAPPSKQSGVARPNRASLLDQILAMVLGSTSPPLEMSSEDFIAWQKKQHREIVDDWLSHFGRLPKPLGVDSDPTRTKDIEDDQVHLVTETERDELRKSFGLNPDNTIEDWDDDVDEVQSKPIVSPKPRAVGLRPGGKV